ncbi:hypothetical protein [Nocardia sp. NPDC058666]|uniref:hypothetical protein n=1 Tax=unclassified Nocardia TaxID=2637762 RepID=UPI00366A0B96
MKFRIALSTTVVAASLLLAGCQEDLPAGKPAATPTTTAASKAPATPNADGVLNPGDVGKLEDGVEVSILKVETAQLERQGTVTAFTFQLNNTSKTALEYWSAPKIVYGEEGTPAEAVMTSDKTFGYSLAGKLPPGSKQTIKIAYAVPMDKLNPAVITSDNVIWRGDFAKFSKS